MSSFQQTVQISPLSLVVFNYASLMLMIHSPFTKIHNSCPFSDLAQSSPPISAEHWTLSRVQNKNNNKHIQQINKSRYASASTPLTLSRVVFQTIKVSKTNSLSKNTKRTWDFHFFSFHFRRTSTFPPPQKKRFPLLHIFFGEILPSFLLP